ncbi:hypothetical protein H4219_001526 [Mycoemilia scoparia]|uniref:Yeast cell wall synthesis Kre9/Knh1-like N-terminal domain-containing protein n=1 Tax=Mycoemilia scoparia TaxID=417184 RepID=A0A9W8A3C0_9FUNG|nr:hypothetical protein H4219_001526 [Mycoemilia scoparia]
MKVFAISTLIFAALALGDSLQINSPVKGTKLTANENSTVTWISSDGKPLTGNVSIEIMSGDDPNNLKSIAVVGQNVPATAGAYSFHLPANLPHGSNYAVRVTSSDGTMHYSHYFDVSNTNSPTSSASASVSASSSASQSASKSSESESASASASSSRKSQSESESESESESKSASSSKSHSSSSSESESSESSESKSSKASRSHSRSGDDDHSSESEGAAVAIGNSFSFGVTAAVFAFCAAQLY